MSLRTRACRTGAFRAPAVLLAVLLLVGVAYAAVPNAPAVVGMAGIGRVTLSWSKVVANPPVQKYQVRYSFDDILTAAWEDVPGGAGARSYTVTGLDDGRFYAFHVRAVNADGNGQRSLEIVQPLVPNVETPSGFTATGGFRKLDLSWNVAVGLVTVERYQYRLRTDGDDRWGLWTDIPGSDESTTRCCAPCARGTRRSSWTRTTRRTSAASWCSAAARSEAARGPRHYPSACW